jgi:short-subunit dehydrogenase
VRRQFETNVFGLARMAQLVLPGMRTAGSGRIVNVSSMGGRIVFPVVGYYHASKYAVEAISDALRFEVRPFGVRVSIVEPGLIRTAFGDKAAQALSDSAVPDGPYAALNTAAEKQMAFGYHSTLLTVAPETVAATIERAIVSRRPRIRYVVTPAAKTLVTSRRLLGARAWDAYLSRQFRTT